MRRCSSHDRGNRLGATVAAVALVFGLGWMPADALRAEPPSIPNNLPIQNPGGQAATFSTSPGGFVDLTGQYFQAQGSNGRSCASCHIPQEAWSINPGTLQRLFDETGGTHPVFNPLDANNPLTGDFSTVEGRRAAYSTLLSRGVFRRGGALNSSPLREWDLIAVEDPNGFANLTRLVHWRRVMPTINFALGSATINWDGGNNIGTDQLGGLENQARRNVTGAQQGEVLPTFPAPLDPPFNAIIPNILGFETSLFTAQFNVPGVGNLSDGARGGPEAMSSMTKAAGRFDLFDGWANHENPRRRQIFRGQELFNNPNPGGRTCGGCHNSANNGTNVGNALFDIQTASEAARTPDLPLYTFQKKGTGEIRKLTDAGRGNVSNGLWADLGKFKTPTLRGLAARAPYFHNGIAATLPDVVRHYETQLGFIFTDAQRADLVAFLNAL